MRTEKMVILKWLNSILTGPRSETVQAAAGQASDEVNKKKNGKSVDLANAALVEHAEDLEELINIGSDQRDKKKLKFRIRNKVRQVLSDEYSDPELVEDITERISDAAEVDPFYRNLFNRDAS